MNKNIIVVNNLTKKYKNTAKFALNGIDLKIRKGSIFGLRLVMAQKMNGARGTVNTSTYAFSCFSTTTADDIDDIRDSNRFGCLQDWRTRNPNPRLRPAAPFTACACLIFHGVRIHYKN